MPIDNFNEDTQLAKVIRSMIQHEDTLRNHRVTWELIVQGFFIGIAGDLWKTGDNEIIIIMIAIVAISLLFSFMVTVKKNDEAITKLVNMWRDQATELELETIPITGCRFELDEEDSEKKDKLLIWNCLPWILITFWLFIILFINL